MTSNLNHVFDSESDSDSVIGELPVGGRPTSTSTIIILLLLSSKNWVVPTCF